MQYGVMAIKEMYKKPVYFIVEAEKGQENPFVGRDFKTRKAAEKTITEAGHEVASVDPFRSA